MMLKMNVHACSLKCSPKDDSLFYLIAIQMVGWKLEQLEVKVMNPPKVSLEWKWT